jgi:hypothetical protein
MTAVAVRNEPTFKPITGPSLSPAAGGIFMSGDFPAVSTLSLTSASTATHGGWLHELRYFVGAALAGSVLCGLALGWAAAPGMPRELFQGVGALMGVVWYAAMRGHFRD